MSERINETQLREIERRAAEFQEQFVQATTVSEAAAIDTTFAAQAAGLVAEIRYLRSLFYAEPQEGKRCQSCHKLKIELFDTRQTGRDLICEDCARLQRESREAVDHPAHYGGDTAYEHVKVCVAWGLDHDAFLYNCTKYICRVGRKKGADPLEDLRKARWYLDQAIKQRAREPSCDELDCPDPKRGRHSVYCDKYTV